MMQPYKFKCVNIRLIMDDMCIPHIESEIFTDNMSGVKNSFMNVKAYCKADSVEAAVMEVENYILNIRNMSVEDMKLDWQTSHVDPTANQITSRIMEKLRQAPAPKSWSLWDGVPQSQAPPAPPAYALFPENRINKLNAAVEEMMKFIESHPANVPDFWSQTKKGIEKMNNFVRNVLNESFSPEDSKYITSEIAKRRPMVF